MEWSLPAGSPDPEGFYAISTVNWTTMDLDGDGKPDLVVTAGATDSNPRWLFYKNTGSGFAETATDWSLPTESPTSEGFWTTANDFWNTTDLDGDGKPDLVVIYGANDGNRRWLVYKNTGSGFAKTATKWTLPGNAPDFHGFSDVISDTWTTMDLDGDGKPDLVAISSSPETDRRWLVYKNTGNGFATTATDWSLPAGSPNSISRRTKLAFEWTTMDLDGDGKPDLVVHFDTSMENPLWLVYANTGHGFAETATEWSLPEDSPVPEGFFRVNYDYWTTMDLDGDGKPDLVVNGGASEETPRWLFYKNTGSAFAETALVWSLPAGSPDPYGYHSLASDDWATMDLDGDGKPDLVVSYGASESNRRWLLYKNTP